MKKTYQGSCHCGEIRFEADLDLSAGTGKCNCSVCTKARYWAAIVPPQDFHLVRGEEYLSDYRFGNRVSHHFFCKQCGIKPFGRGYVEALGGDYVSINIATLDNVEPRELADAPVKYFDGRNNNWQSEPAEIRHL